MPGSQILAPLDYQNTQERQGVYLRKVVTVVEGGVSLNGGKNMTKVEGHEGPRAIRTLECRALMVAGSSATFIEHELCKQVLAC